MWRERTLKIVLMLVGLLFTAMIYPLMMFVRQEPALAMMLSLYVTLGIFLLLAARNPSANRSLIAFTAWSSFVHAMLMAGQAFANLIARGELVGSVVLVVIGIALIVLAPAKQPVEQPSAIAASNTLRRVHKTSRQAGLRCGLLLVTAIDDEDRNLDVGHEVHRILFRQCKATRR